MLKAAIAAALLVSGAAIAQTTVDDETDLTTDPMDITTTEPTTSSTADPWSATTDPTIATEAPVTTTETTTLAYNTTPASGQVVQPGNDNPEHDARGIAVISDPAFVPAGFNGIAATAMGGPVEGAADTYPPCTAEVTDNCTQTYERGID